MAENNQPKSNQQQVDEAKVKALVVSQHGVVRIGTLLMRRSGVHIPKAAPLPMAFESQVTLGFPGAMRCRCLRRSCGEADVQRARVHSARTTDAKALP